MGRTNRLTLGISLEEYMFWARREHHLEERKEVQSPALSEIKRMLAYIKPGSRPTQALELDRHRYQNEIQEGITTPGETIERDSFLFSDATSTIAANAESQQALRVSRTIG